MEVNSVVSQAPTATTTTSSIAPSTDVGTSCSGPSTPGTDIAGLQNGMLNQASDQDTILNKWSGLTEISTSLGSGDFTQNTLEDAVSAAKQGFDPDDVASVLSGDISLSDLQDSQSAQDAGVKDANVDAVKDGDMTLEAALKDKAKALK